MATWKSFEEINAWQLARQLNKKVHNLILASEIRNNRRLCNQMYGSAGSIMDNIAEGFERDSNREFSLFLSYAKGSAGELRSQLYRALDFQYITDVQFSELAQDARNISGKLYNMIKYVRNTPIKGQRHQT